MKRLTLGLALLMLTSCTSMMAAKQQSAHLRTPPDRTYACAMQTMIAMGGTDLRSDTQGGIVSCTIHRAIQLTAQVRREDGESRIQVTGTPIPGQIAIGSFNEVEQYLAKVQECK